jgi:Cu/Ag efflux protein CusF
VNPSRGDADAHSNYVTEFLHLPREIGMAWNRRYSMTGYVRSSVLAVTVLLTGTTVTVDAVSEEAASKPEQTRQFSGKSITQMKAIIFEIDVARNSITLLQENGEPIDVVVDRSVGDVSTFKTGDSVSITYSRALLLRADKVSLNGIRERIDSGFTTAQSDSSLSMHRVRAITTVERIDRDRQQLTLRGPTRTVTLKASSDGLLQGLKVGDSVRVDFVEATAIHISRDRVPLR